MEWSKSILGNTWDIFRSVGNTGQSAFFCLQSDWGRDIMSCCPLGINPFPQPFLVGCVTVSVGSSFALQCHWAFYSVLCLAGTSTTRPPLFPSLPAFACLSLWKAGSTLLVYIIFLTEKIVLFVFLQKPPQDYILHGGFTLYFIVWKNSSTN